MVTISDFSLCAILQRQRLTGESQLIFMDPRTCQMIAAAMFSGENLLRRERKTGGYHEKNNESYRIILGSRTAAHRVRRKN